MSDKTDTFSKYSFCYFAYVINPDVRFSQIKVKCCKANLSADTLHQKSVLCHENEMLITVRGTVESDGKRN
jgi:hypothetical protein